MHAVQQGAAISPLTDEYTPLAPEEDPDASSGHGKTIHVTGSIPPRPSSAAVMTDGLWFDTYYQQPQLYPDSLNVAYPFAGVGFGFTSRAKPTFDPSQNGKYVGVVFDMETLQNTRTIDVQLALVCSATNGNDLNNGTSFDGFESPGCTYPRMQTTDDTLTQQATDYVSGPNNYTSQTCFLYEHKTIEPVEDNHWGTYCLLWNEMSLPDWAGANAQPPVWSDETLATCATKINWEMYRPSESEPLTAFNVYLDNVKLITRSEAGQYHCDLGALPADSTQVIGPR